MIWFTSDLHINHDRDFIYEPRGFSSVKEMNEEEIDRWNMIVDPEDDIYVVGDFCLGSDMEYINEVVSTLKGKIHLLVGNHDTRAKIALYKTLPNIVSIDAARYLDYRGYTFYISHYPCMTVNPTDAPNKKVVFNLFGHTHSKDSFYDDTPYMYNVAVDAHNCYPVSLDRIIKDIAGRFEALT